MIAKLRCVVLDCADVGELAAFYQALVGGEVNRPDRRWVLGEGWRRCTWMAGWCWRLSGSRTIGRPGGRIRRAAAVSPGSGVADPAGHPFCLVRE